MALHFLLALTGDLNTDPEDVASYITSALWDWQNDLFLKMRFFSFLIFLDQSRGGVSTGSQVLGK